MATTMKALAMAALSFATPAASRAEGDDLILEMADSVLAWKEELLPIPFEMILERDVGYVGEHPIMDNSTTVVKQGSLGTVREVTQGLSPNIPIGAAYIKDSDQPPMPASTFRMGGTVGGADMTHLNGVVNPTAELTVWQWQRNKYFGVKAWLDVWLTRFPDKIVVVHSGGDVLYGGCDENSLQYKYEQVVAANGGTQKIVLAAEVSPYPQDLGFTYAQSTAVETLRTSVLSDFGVSSTWASSYANCTGEMNSVCDITPKYRYASSAFIMGPVSDVSDMLSGLAQFTGLENRYASEYFFEHPDLVAIDFAGILSMSLHNMVKNGATPVEIVNTAGTKSIQSKVTGQKVCFVHGNGNAFGALKAMATELKA